MSIKFAIAPINWSNDDDHELGGDIPLEQCLSEMREAGYDGCEIGNKFPKSSDALIAIQKQYSLAITSDWLGVEFTSRSQQEELDKFRSKIPLLKKVGIQALKVCEVGHAIQQTGLAIFHNKVQFSTDQWDRLIGGLNAMGDIANEHSMFVSYHHHLGTGIESEHDIDQLMTKTDSGLVSLLPDTGHLLAASADPLTIIKRYIERIRYVHLKDVRTNIMSQSVERRYSFMDAVRAGLFTVPSDGDIDFTPIFSLLKDRYQGWLVVEAEQDPAKAPPLLLAQKARKYLATYFENATKG